MQPLSSWLSYRTFGVGDPFDPEHRLVTSPVLPSIVLGVLRLLFAIYTLVTVSYVLHYTVAVNGSATYFFPYFTDLTYTGICSYFWASSVQTLAYALTGKKMYPLQRWPRVLQVLHLILWSTITTFPFIVTIVFWGLLSDSSTFATLYSRWSAVSVHAMNTGFALFEILLTNAGPSAWINVIPVFICIALYLPVAYINYANTGYYTYAFLDPRSSHGLLAAYIIGIGAGTIIVFVIVRGITMLRRHLSRGRGLSSAGDGPTHEEIDEWQEVELAEVPISLEMQERERDRKESNPASSTAGASSAV
ncbi:hypothetical protein CONPUDRAFT_85151 [Coniophora puteana RWD-64-598 SS2]|uniref:Uncharacterized protein n=1 Tax=Coniophora puteana (strain RWD-64-598) TaxID=741705 RepID=A0A5M3MBB8_CONPW|nr:uncharacterized protein CONPUDRAFT_85151 [Coniophora puteana RWD-64-598 SS2]EIW75925.1 hypothetical protein CONPUDRAFT_85151 [Coniophora puteana RWD-64-598 SS2]